MKCQQSTCRGLTHLASLDTSHLVFYRSNALTKNAAICARVTESFGQ